MTDTVELLEREAELTRVKRRLEQEIAERKQAQETLAKERLVLRTLIDHLPDAIYAKDTAGRKILSNPGDVRNVQRKTEAEVLGRTDFDFYPPHIASGYAADDQIVLQTGQPVLWREERLFDAKGDQHCILTSKLPMRSTDGTIVGLVGIGRDITPLKQAQEKMESLHRNLLITSRQAGMAEVATSVLHNVGNVLNSVNVSASLINDRLGKLKVEQLFRLAKLLREHQADLAHFLSNDQTGNHVTAFLEHLAAYFENEQTALREEVKTLATGVDHINQIVAMQQDYARIGGVTEHVALEEIVEDALRFHSAAYVRHGIAIVRNYEEALPTILTDRHRVLQILVNLLSNAKYACNTANHHKKQVTVRIKRSDERSMKIQVADTGIGISPDNLTRIFSQGFTTRKDGHGFGLHSSALAAAELKGSISAHSDGLGKGATFTLELPIRADCDGGTEESSVETSASGTTGQGRWREGENGGTIAL